MKELYRRTSDDPDVIRDRLAALNQEIHELRRLQRMDEATPEWLAATGIPWPTSPRQRSLAFARTPALVGRTIVAITADGGLTLDNDASIHAELDEDDHPRLRVRCPPNDHQWKANETYAYAVCLLCGTTWYSHTATP